MLFCSCSVITKDFPNCLTFRSHKPCICLCPLCLSEILPRPLPLPFLSLDLSFACPNQCTVWGHGSHLLCKNALLVQLQLRLITAGAPPPPQTPTLSRCVNSNSSCKVESLPSGSPENFPDMLLRGTGSSKLIHLADSLISTLEDASAYWRHSVQDTKIRSKCHFKKISPVNNGTHNSGCHLKITG